MSDNSNYYLIIILIILIISAAIIIGLLWNIKEEIPKIHTTPQSLVLPDVSIAFDRSSYVANSTARVTVIDNNATTYSHDRLSIFVEVMSTSDPQGIRLELQEKTNQSAYFVDHPYKLILTSLKSNQTIAALKVSPGDTITAIYSNGTMSSTSIAQILVPVPHPNVIGASIFTTQLPATNSFSTTLNPTFGNTQFQADNGAILSCYNDVDNDGICDEWEDPGDPNYAGSGVGITIPAVGPSNTQYHLDCNNLVPNDCPGSDKQDIYVEVDYMNGQGITQRPDPATLDMVKQAFLNHGIRLHYYIDDNEINQIQNANTGIGYYTNTLQVPGNPTDPPGYSSFFAIKKQFFGNATDTTCSSTGDPRSPSCGTDNGAQEIKDWLTAKRQFFHYVLFIHAQQGNVGSSGWSEQFGNDFVVSLGDFSQKGQGSPDEIAGTFMHELGHNLNLGHGGNPLDTQNCKPNYQSVMGYSYQFPYLAFNGGNWNGLDYSETSTTLDESNLIESNGVGYKTNPNSVVYGITSTSGTVSINTGPLAGTNGINWNGDTVMSSTPEVSEINNLGIPECSENNLNQLTSQNDWQNLNLLFTTSSNFQSGATIYPRSSANELSRGDLDKMLNEMYGSDFTGIDLNGHFYPTGPLINSTGHLMSNGTSQP